MLVKGSMMSLLEIHRYRFFDSAGKKLTKVEKLVFNFQLKRKIIVILARVQIKVITTERYIRTNESAEELLQNTTMLCHRMYHVHRNNII